MRLLLITSVFIATLLDCSAARADVTPALPIGDGMVLQRGMDAPVFGTASAGERVKVTFRGRARSALVEEGRWRVDIPTGAPGGPWPLVIEGQNRIDLKNVYVGDVWLCSGQSNMVWSVRQSGGGAEAIAGAPTLETIRLLQVSQRPDAPRPAWQAVSPQSIPNFSAVAYYFARVLQERVKVPIGLIQSAVGGTMIEQWMSLEKLRALGFGERLRPSAAGLYTAMIRPLIPYGMKGVLWYQGESNAGDAGNYLALHRGMIEQWRKEWGQGNFPFLFAQLARINTPPAADPVGTWPRLREAQRQTIEVVPRTAMAVVFDVSDGDIHPPDKKSVGERLALAARSLAYGEDVEYSGPVLRSAERHGDRVILTFAHAEGLAARGGSIQDVEIEIAATQFRPTTATVEGNRIIVDVTGSAGPVRVLHGWRAFPRGNLYNLAGLPASPFATLPLP